MEQGRGIGHPFASQVKAAEFPEHGYVVEGIFAGFVGHGDKVMQVAQFQFNQVRLV